MSGVKLIRQVELVETTTSRTEVCLRKAAECEGLAKLASTSEWRIGYHQLPRQWLKIAKQAELL
jgi:hypothetical protein